MIRRIEDAVTLRLRLDETEAALERARAEREIAFAALFTVRRALTGGLTVPTLEELLHEVIDPALALVTGEHPSASGPC